MYSVQRVALSDLSGASEADLLKMRMPLQMAELTRFRQRSPVFLWGTGSRFSGSLFQRLATESTTVEAYSAASGCVSVT